MFKEHEEISQLNCLITVDVGLAGLSADRASCADASP